MRGRVRKTILALEIFVLDTHSKHWHIQSVWPLYLLQYCNMKMRIMCIFFKIAIRVSLGINAVQYIVGDISCTVLPLQRRHYISSLPIRVCMSISVHERTCTKYLCMIVFVHRLIKLWRTILLLRVWCLSIKGLGYGSAKPMKLKHYCVLAK